MPLEPHDYEITGPHPLVTALGDLLQGLSQGHEGMQEPIEVIRHASLALVDVLSELHGHGVEDDNLTTLIEVRDITARLSVDADRLGLKLAAAKDQLQWVDLDLQG